MSSRGKNVISIPTSEELLGIEKFEQTAKELIADAIKSIYRLQGWSAKDLDRRITGVGEKRWQAYGRSKYDRPRYLHVVAALSWLTQISMSAFYRGDINNYWSEVDATVIECITYTNMLPAEQFLNFVYQVLSKLERAGYEIREKIVNKLEMLNEYGNIDFLIPEVLDSDAFGQEYYRSMAREFYQIRIDNAATPEAISYALGISVEKYYQYENPNVYIPIPVEIGLRLKLALKCDTVRFVEHMNDFSGFGISRKIQELREQVLIELIPKDNLKLKSAIRDLAHNSMLFHLI